LNRRESQLRPRAAPPLAICLPDEEAPTHTPRPPSMPINSPRLPLHICAYLPSAAPQSIPHPAAHDPVTSRPRDHLHGCTSPP
jgi:hypothetical protein